MLAGGECEGRVMKLLLDDIVRSRKYHDVMKRKDGVLATVFLHSKTLTRRLFSV